MGSCVGSNGVNCDAGGKSDVLTAEHNAAPAALSPEISAPLPHLVEQLHPEHVSALTLLASPPVP
jgi:hypothetical protein